MRSTSPKRSSRDREQALAVRFWIVDRTLRAIREALRVALLAAVVVYLIVAMIGGHLLVGSVELHRMAALWPR